MFSRVGSGSRSSQTACFLSFWVGFPPWRTPSATAATREAAAMTRHAEPAPPPPRLLRFAEIQPWRRHGRFLTTLSLNGVQDPVKSFSGLSIGGQDVKTSIELSFLEALQGCTKTVTFLTDVLCNTCGGSGVRSGTGPKTSEHRKGSGGVSFCKSCKGAKVIKGTESVKFDIIPGVDDGETIKVFKRGGADPDGDRPGHLYVAIKVRKDPVFWRDGYDIHVKTVISSTRALYGGTTYVPTLTGDAGVEVPRGTQHGDVLVLEEKGIKDKYSWDFGNLYVHFIVKSR